MKRILATIWLLAALCAPAAITTGPSGSGNVNSNSVYQIIVANVNTNPASLITNLWVLNTVYTNAYPSPSLIQQDVFLTVAAVNGSATIRLMVDQGGGTTFTKLQSRGIDTTTVVSVPCSFTNSFAASVSNYATFYFTNTSTGAGDAAGLVAGTGLLTVLAGQGLGVSATTATNAATSVAATAVAPIYPGGASTNLAGGNFRTTPQGLSFNFIGAAITNKAPTILWIGDSVAAETQLGMEKTLSQFFRRNGAVGTSRGDYYFTTNGLGMYTNQLYAGGWPVYQYYMSNNSAATWASTMSNGVNATTLEMYHWKSNAFANLTVETQAYGGSWATLAVVSGDNAGSYTAATTNFNFPLVNNLQWRVTSAGSNVLAGVSIWNTNRFAGLREETWVASGLLLTNYTTGASLSNTLFTFLTNMQPTMIIVEIKDTTEATTNGIIQLEGIVANACPLADVVYVGAPPNLDGGFGYPETSVMARVAANYGRSFVDLTGAFTPTNRSRYLGDGTGAHQADSGEYAGGGYLLQALSLDYGNLISLGLTNLNGGGGGSVDTSTLAKLNVGNIFTGTQTNLGDVYDSAYHILLGGSSAPLQFHPPNAIFSIHARSGDDLVVRDDENPANGFILLHQGAGVYYMSPTNTGSGMDLGQNASGKGWANIYGTNITTLSGGTFTGNGGGLTNLPAQTNFISYGKIVLSDGATVSTDASLGVHFQVTLGGNRTLGNPTNPRNGQCVTWEFIQDGTGSRTIAFDTKFRFGTDIPSATLTTTAAKRDYVKAVYDLTADKWDVIGFAKGY